MNVTATPAAKSSVVLEVEVPQERLARAVDDAVRALSRRTKVAGFRPGKAPRPVLERVLGPGAVLDEAVDHLMQTAYREALVEKAILPLTNAEVQVVLTRGAREFVTPLTFAALTTLTGALVLLRFFWPRASCRCSSARRENASSNFGVDGPPSFFSSSSMRCLAACSSRCKLRSKSTNRSVPATPSPQAE